MSENTEATADKDKDVRKPSVPGGPGGGIASLLGSTASILGSTFTKEEDKPKFSLKPEDVEKYKAAFNDFDHNKDGHISTKELIFAFRRAGINPNEEEVQDIINNVDTDYSGKIEWPEFAAALAEKLKPDEDEEVSYKETFRVFSKDENGCITADEMKFVLSQVCSMEEAETMMDVVDRNGDGVISFSEFRCMMGANPVML